MQAKSSVSDYRESSDLSWTASPLAAALGTKKPKLAVLSSKTKPLKLKPGLY